MESAINVLTAHRDVCVSKSIAASKRNRMKLWETWCDKANDACNALDVLMGRRSPDGRLIPGK